jgi:hypothetical protein
MAMTNRMAVALPLLGPPPDGQVHVASGSLEPDCCSFARSVVRAREHVAVDLTPEAKLILKKHARGDYESGIQTEDGAVVARVCKARLSARKRR